MTKPNKPYDTTPCLDSSTKGLYKKTDVTYLRFAGFFSLDLESQNKTSLLSEVKMTLSDKKSKSKLT